MIRQGDILLVPVALLPTGAKAIRKKKGEDVIVAAGEATGHHHRIVAGQRVREYRQGRRRFLSVPRGGAKLTHEEHDTLTIPGGKHEIVNQREYAPRQAPVRVYD